jgi:hypothetical protein
MDESSVYLLAFLIKFVLVGLVIGWIPAVIAKSKGRNFFAWWFYGTALFIVALIHAIVMKPRYGSAGTSSTADPISQPTDQGVSPPRTWKCDCGEINIAMAQECRKCGDRRQS